MQLILMISFTTVHAETPGSRGSNSNVIVGDNHYLLLQQGHRVFLMSWKNPNSEMAKVGFEDYVVDGALNAINIVSDVTKQKV